jgi:hypothetical protein
VTNQVASGWSSSALKAKVIGPTSVKSASSSPVV